MSTKRPHPKMAPTIALTREQVRQLLEEGRACREDIEKRIRKMEIIPLEDRLTPAR